MSNVKVAVRVRPPIESELRNGTQPSWIARGNTIYMDSGKINAFHTFDHVFDCTSTNSDVYYKYCHPIVESVMQGFNGTIFAFGQTSSGKTHTMMGTASQPGLIPLAINAIFNIIENAGRSECKSVPEREYLIRVSYIEIYNESIMDLLDPANGKNLQIRDNSDGQPTISDLTELTVGSKEEIQAAMGTGERHRHVASTEANQRSSRSHTIFRVVIESSLRDGVDRAVTVGQLNLVDLAGSERSEQCGDAAERFRESTRINLSLTFLTQVISKLSRGESGHINFRDSKLTRILRNSLGGNAHTAIVCTVNPFCADQTLRTLQFASSAKKIRNTPVVNESISNDTLIRRHHREIEKLKCQIKAMQATKNEDLCKTLLEKDSLIDELNSKVRSLEAKLVVSTLPAPSIAEWRRQRRETWAAPSCVQRDLTNARTASEDTVPREALDVFQEWPGRLSTVVEESESFHAISNETFEKHFQVEERTRRSAALHLADGEPTTPHACNGVSCAERIKFLENELTILKKDHEELKELTTLERLMCNTSRRPFSSGKPDEAASTPPLPGQLKECCIKTLQTSQRCQERVSRRPGGSKFFSPVYASPMLPSADGDSSTSSSSHDDQEGECVQASNLCARLTPRTTLWTPGHSPVVGTPGTPGLNPLARTPQDSNQPVSKPLCVDEATQTGDVQCMQMLQHPVTLCSQTHDDSMLQNILPVVDAACQTDSEDGCKKPEPSIMLQNILPVVDAACQTDSEDGCKKPGPSTQMQSAASRMDVHFDTREAVDSAVQYDSLLQNCKARERAINAIDCEVQTALSVQECMVQTELSLLHLIVADCGVQAIPYMLDAATEVDQVSRIIMLDADAQTALLCSHDRSVQSECYAPSEALADCEVQAVPFTKDSASQVNSSLESQEISRLESTQLPFVTSNSSRLEKSLVSQLGTHSSGSASTNHWHKPRVGNVWAAVKTSLRESSEESEGSKTLSDGQSTPLLSYRNDAANTRTKEFALGTQTVTGIEQVPRISLVDTCVQTNSSRDRSTQSVLGIPRSAVADCEVQAVLPTSDRASQVNTSLALQEVGKSESVQCCANYSSGQPQKSLVSKPPDGAPKPPAYSAWMSASGNDSRLQQKHCSGSGGKVLDALRAHMLKTAEDPTANSGSQKVPSSCCRSVKSSFQSGTPAPEIQAWLNHNRKEVDKSESVQCCANYSSGQPQKSLVSKPPDGAPKPPAYSAWMSASGNDSHLQQKHCSGSGGKVLDALRAYMLKTAEDPTADSDSQKVPSSCSRSVKSSFPSGTPAPEIQAWLNHNRKTKESVAVQADALGVQEMEDLRHKVSSMKLSLDANEKALQDKESQLKLQEKAFKKRELQLKAVIRQLQNKETDNMARAALASPTVAASAKEAQPPQSARALVHETPRSFAQRLKAMTPRAREGARLIYFGSSLEEQAVAEQVQMGQLRASLSSHARKLESARKRQQAWADRRSGSKPTVPHSPLKELDKEPSQGINEPAENFKDDAADDMELWPPLKFFMDADNMDSL